MSDFEIHESSDGEVAVLGPRGSLNTQTSPRLEQKLGALLEAKSRLIVVDLKDVDYVSSSALRVLLMTTRRLKRVSGKLLLSGLREEVRKIFAISGFDRDFNIQATSKEAIALAAATELPPLDETKAKPTAKKRAAPAPASEPAAVPAAKAADKEAPPEAAPDPALMLAMKLLSADESAPPWRQWTAAKTTDRWRARVLETLAR